MVTPLTEIGFHHAEMVTPYYAEMVTLPIVNNLYIYPVVEAAGAVDMWITLPTNAPAPSSQRRKKALSR